jgi:putative CocE/NonD family hydrolase
MYFHSSGGLPFEPPSENEGLDEYVSDPARPVPFINYIATAVPQYMVDDQRFAARRTDVLTYQTPPLEDDITVSGPISPELYVTSTGTDSDFVVKVIAVYPDDYPANEAAVTNKRVLGPPSVRMGGYQQLLRGWLMRAKFRNSWENPEPLIPGKVAKLEFTMPDINHTFRKGHRIMVQIQSSWFPLIDRNPQTFVQIPDAKPEDFKKATQQVIHRRSEPSKIELMVLGQ